MTIMTPLSLKNVTVSTVKPYTKSEHPAILKPAVFDLCVMDVYIPMVFFYRSEKGLSADSSKLVDHMKESLSKLLVPYYPFAGRWIRTYDARIRENECTDEGVPFIVASVDEELESVVKLKEYEALEWLGGFQLLGLSAKSLHQDVEFPLPAVFIQVTKFKCGAIALHAAFCHQTADGEGMFSFMSAWSQIALEGKTSIVPNHDRSLTTSFAEYMGPAGPTSEEVTPEEDADAKESTSAPVTGSEETKADPGKAFKVPQQDPMSSNTLHVKRQVIEDLKREAKEKNMEVTTLDLITAHIWCSLNDIPVSIDGKKSSIVGSFVDGRKRFHNPSLPESYIGNAVVLPFTPQIPATELAANSPLFAANLVHSTVRAVNPSTWQKVLSFFIQMLTNFHQLEYRQVIITSWFRYPLYEISFGQGFGKPILASSNLVFDFLPLGLACILPPPPVLSKDAIASVQFTVQNNNGATEALFSDEKFRSFFLQNPVDLHAEDLRPGIKSERTDDLLKAFNNMIK